MQIKYKLKFFFMFLVINNIFMVQDIFCENFTNNSYEIFSTGMVVPLNKIVLIRKGINVGAFRFTYCEEKKAEYEWYYPVGVRKSEIKRGKNNLNDRFVTIIGRLAFQLGNTKIKCGPLKIWWNGYNVVSLYGNDIEKENSSIELAPTNKENINDINPNDPKLKWYKYDETRETIKISLDSL